MANSKRKTGIGLAAWLLVAIVLLIVFLVKWETIHNNLVTSGLLQGEVIEKPENEKNVKAPVEKNKKQKTPKPKKEKNKKNDAITLKSKEEKQIIDIESGKISSNEIYETDSNPSSNSPAPTFKFDQNENALENQYGISSGNPSEENNGTNLSTQNGYNYGENIAETNSVGDINYGKAENNNITNNNATATQEPPSSNQNNLNNPNINQQKNEESAEQKNTPKQSMTDTTYVYGTTGNNVSPTNVTTQPETKPSAKPGPKTDLKLCFIVIDSDGTLNYKIVTRSVDKTETPLATAVKLVLNGPVPSFNTEKNCRTLIPNGTRLLGASISNGIAILNFSDEFEFNPDGLEGYIAQLKQIIFTATQFSSVRAVQFLIEGQKIEYLGSDGVWIGTPLSRASF